MKRKLVETRASLPKLGRRHRRRYFTSLVAATSLAGLGLSLTPIFQSAAQATTATFDVPISVPTQVNVTVGAVCTNHPGPTITINGNALLGANLKEDVIFKNNVIGTQSLTVTGDLKLDITGADLAGNLTVPKQPSVTIDGNTGVGGDPFISLYFMRSSIDSNGVETEMPFADPTVPGPNNALLLGRCVQGLGFHGSAGNGAALNALSKVSLSGVTCSSKGSLVNVGADNSHNGENVHILLDSNPNKVVHEADATGHAKFVAVNGSMPVHKGWGAGGSSANPLVFTQSHIFDTTGINPVEILPVAPENAWGRCKSL